MINSLMPVLPFIVGKIKTLIARHKVDSTDGRGPCASLALARGRREERRTDVPLCCQKAESVPTVNVLKVGEVQSQLGQHCCDVASFEEDDGSRVPTRDVGQELNRGDLARGLDG